MTRRGARRAALAVVLVGVAVGLGLHVVDGEAEPEDAAPEVPCVVAVTESDPEAVGGGVYRIVTITPDGTRTRVSGPDVAVDPDISPDGRRIAYVHAIGDYESAGPDRTEVWTMGIDGSDPTPVVAGGRPYHATPAWSPDGRRIALTSTDGPGDVRIVTVAATGGEVAVVTRPTVGTGGFGTVTAIDWSPDGRRLVYLWRPADYAHPGRTEVRVAGVDGRSDTVRAEVQYGVSIDWSPDGSRLLLAGADGGDGSLAVIDAATGARQDLPHRAGLARWTADGTRAIAIAITATSGDGPRWDLVEVPVPATPGRAARTLAEVGHPGFNLGVGPGC